jgi:trans-2,3-dihydro-3-hydroxyanthranilate isomerase
MKYYHVDVFSEKKFSGNGLTVFADAYDLDKKFMQLLTQEMRQFESIFFHKTGPNTFRAFIFTMEEELDFAGHPIIGAAAMMHDLYSPEKERDTWTIQLNAKPVEVTTVKKDNFYSAKMNQGTPDFGTIVTGEDINAFLSYMNLAPEDKYDDLPLQVVSTGLPYLIIPVKAAALAKVRITINDLESRLIKKGAKFFYVFDIENRQGRTWDNFGLVEDIATGSAAGPVGAYLVKNGLEKYGNEIIVKQGDFLNRPSKIKILVTSDNGTIGDVYVEGDVCKIGNGELLI